MIIVHDTFVCKPGNASKVAKLFKEAMAGVPGSVTVMTDVTGQYHRVIMVSQFEDLAAYGKSMETMSNPPEETKIAMKKLEGYQDMYLTGSREIYKTW